MWLKEEEFTIRLGGSLFVDQPVLIAYRGTPLFSVIRQDDGYLAVDFHIYNANGDKIATVRRNNIYFGSKDAYALHGEPDRLTLIDKRSGLVIIDIKRRAEAAPAELDISLRTYLPDGRLLDLGQETSNIAGIFLTGCTLRANKGAGVNIG